MTIAIQQLKVGQNSGGTGVSTTVTATQAGSTIVAFLCHYAAFMSQATVTGPTGFTLLHEDFIANYSQIDIYYKDNESSGVTSYSAVGGNNIQKALFIFELTSSKTSGSGDQHASANGNSTSPSVTTPALSQASEAILGVCTAAQNAAITADASATSSIETHSVNGAFVAQGKIVNSTAATNFANTITSGKWLSSIGTFEDTSAGGGGGGGGGVTSTKIPSIPSIVSV